MMIRLTGNRSSNPRYGVAKPAPLTALHNTRKVAHRVVALRSRRHRLLPALFRDFRQRDGGFVERALGMTMHQMFKAFDSAG